MPKQISGKEAIFAATGVFFNFWCFWAWYKIIPSVLEGKVASYWNFGGAVLILLLAVSFAALAAVFIRPRFLSYGSVILGLSLPYFFLRSSKQILAVWVFTALLAWFATYCLRREMSLSLGFSVSKIFKSGMGTYFTIAALIISLFYLQVAQTDNVKAISALLPKSAATSVLKFLLSGLLGAKSEASHIPKLDFSKTTDEFLLELVRSQVGAKGGSVSDQELKQFVRQGKNELAKKYGIVLEGDEKMQDAFYKAIAEKTRSLFGPYQSYIPLVSAVVFFLAFKAFSWPLYYLAVILSFLLIKFLIFAKILRKKEEDIKIERLTL